jgi:hypothetical protein
MREQEGGLRFPEVQIDQTNPGCSSMALCNKEFSHDTEVMIFCCFDLRTTSGDSRYRLPDPSCLHAVSGADWHSE